MKPAPFRYEAPSTVEEACALLAEHGDDAKVLAGGQSLGPLMNLRLASPAVVVDINRIGGLDAIDARDGELGVGALVRQRQAERSPVLLADAPLVVEALRWVGHLGVRNRGTVAGSIAHADPAAELPAVLTALGGRVRAVGRDGERLIPVEELFETYFTTVLQPEELITEVLWPRRPPRTGHAWVEFAQRHGDYAIVGVGATVTVDATGACRGVRLVCTGIDSVPYDASDAAGSLVGSPPTAAARAEVAERVAAGCSPSSDALADAAFRRRLVRALVPRTLEQAERRAASGGGVGG